MGNRIAENSSGNCSLAAGTLIRASTFIRVRRVGGDSARQPRAQERADRKPWYKKRDGGEMEDQDRIPCLSICCNFQF